MRRSLQKQIGKNHFIGWSIEDVAKWPTQDKRDTLRYVREVKERKGDPLSSLWNLFASQLEGKITATQNVFPFPDR